MPMFGTMPHQSTHQPGGSDDLGLDFGDTGGQFVETYPRRLVQSATAFTSGWVAATHFTPRVARTISNLAIFNTTTAASGLTGVRLGLAVVNADGTMNLVCAGAKDTSGSISANTLYSQAIAYAGDLTTAKSSYALIPGQRYAFLIFIAGTTMPNPTVISTNASFHAFTIPGQSYTPHLATYGASAADLPSGSNISTVNGNMSYIYWGCMW